MKGSHRICAVIADRNADISQISVMADLFEVRIDLIGNGWGDIARRMPKPWIACNRRKEEGGKWQRNEDNRIEELLKALPLGADIIDIELATPGLDKIVSLIKRKTACLISYHNLTETPAFDELKEIISVQIAAGADICKIVTFATGAEDNLTVLRLISEFPGKRIIAFTMGDKGLSSRILCPLVGGDFTYAALERGAESAAGQITLKEMFDIYRMIKNET
jgi:3-dehydroquinate dehydratase type I